ncbi:MAG: hypothetical protein HQL15_05155 [Candidatus Omnitrophica bacterium]|nr:hypothetical protein [Candidatus Omnitrophota bacterium]
MKRTPFVHIGILTAFLLNSFGALPLASAAELNLPKPGVMVHLSPEFNPPILKGLKVHTDNPFRFDFIVNKGDSSLANDQLKEESSKLIKYFLASLTIPEKDLWVNLSPYEKDRIVPESFGQTGMGRDLLSEDYMLKQITASLIFPEDAVGKKFWKRIYEEAAKKYGTTNIPVNTFNKVWIVPEKAVVYENAKVGAAYVVEAKLKVMLEQDYLSLEKHEGIQSKGAVSSDTNQLGNQIVREVVIPELTREVNEGKNFSSLRQVYNSLILAAWYKKKIKDSILSSVYQDRNKIAGVNIDDPQEKQKIYQQYLKAFKKGVYNYIKEDFDPMTQERIPRKYFSGGVNFSKGDTAMVGLGDLIRKVGMFPDNAALADAAEVAVNVVAAGENQINSFSTINDKNQLVGQESNQIEQTQKSNQREDSSVAFQYTLKNGSMVNVVIRSGMASILRKIGISNEDFIAVAEKELGKNSSNEYEWGALERQLYSWGKGLYKKDYIEVFAPYEDDKEIIQELPKELAVKILLLRFFRAIQRPRKMDKLLGFKSEILDVEKKYFALLSDDEHLEIIQAALQTQHLAGRFNDLVKRPRRGLFKGGRLERFQQFLNTHRAKMNLDSLSLALSIVVSAGNLYEGAEYAEWQKLEGTIRQMGFLFRKMWDAEEKMSDEGVDTLDEQISFVNKLLSIDPNSISQKARLLVLNKQVKERDLLSNASLKAQEKANLEINEILNEIQRALQGNDHYYALALMEIASKKSKISLEEMNRFLVLLPGIRLLGTKRAIDLNQQIFSQYREAYIERILASKTLTEEQALQVGIIYNEAFFDSTESRKAKILEAVPDVAKGSIDSIERDFQELSLRLHEESVALNRNIKNSVVPIVKNLEEAFDRDISKEENLKRAKEYFSIKYGIVLDIPYDEDFSRYDRHKNRSMSNIPEYYSRKDISRILERLAMLDKAVALLPRWLVLNSISLQRFQIVREARANFSHSDSIEHNQIVVDLESDHMLQTLFHEWGHSLHGERGSFAAPIIKERIQRAIEKNLDVFPQGFSEEAWKDNPGNVVWEAFQTLFNMRLAAWRAFNKEQGIEDLNIPFKDRDQKKFEAKYGIGMERFSDRENIPALSIEYIFEEPALDSDSEELVRKEPIELIAEYSQLYVLHPAVLQKFDPVGYDLMEAVIGHVSRRDVDLLSKLTQSVSLAAQGDQALVTNTQDKKHALAALKNLFLAVESGVGDGSVSTNNSSVDLKRSDNPSPHKVDGAMTTNGGIDLSSDKALVVKNSGEGIKFHLDPAQLVQLQNAPGFTPVIISIQPMTDLRGFFGLNNANPSVMVV